MQGLAACPLRAFACTCKLLLYHKHYVYQDLPHEGARCTRREGKE